MWLKYVVVYKYKRAFKYLMRELWWTEIKNSDALFRTAVCWKYITRFTEHTLSACDHCSVQHHKERNALSVTILKANFQMTVLLLLYCQPEILNHYQKPANCMFLSLHIIILTRASRYSTLLSNVVSFSFSTASRERQDMSVIKQTEITPWVINIWVLNYYLNGFYNRPCVPSCSNCIAIVPNGDGMQTLPDVTIVMFRKVQYKSNFVLGMNVHLPPSIKFWLIIINNLNLH